MQDTASNPADNSGPHLTQEELAALVAKMESDENLKHLAEKLFDEWKQQPENSESEPDLTFAKFAEKLKGQKDQ